MNIVLVIQLQKTAFISNVGQLWTEIWMKNKTKQKKINK